VTREPGLSFDLDGVAKGWIADRALALLARHPGAIVDADGDVAVRLAPGESIDVAVDDPREDGHRLAVLTLAASTGRTRWGVATSGTSVHRWRGPGGETHHLIDPRTGRPAATDVIQCTAIASSARVAEALAKTAVVLGAAHGIDYLDRAGALGAILLLDDGRVVALPRITELFA
jgi:thiamine biosynthesis lipoprotein